MKSTRSLHKLFEEAQDNLAILITRTRQLRRLTRELRRLLEPELAPHCYVSQIEDNQLVVYVDSAAWATRLRFQAAQLLPTLRAANPAFRQLTQIRVSIVTHARHREMTPPDSAGPAMNQDNANIINTLSNSIDDPPLQQALRRLARNARKT